MWFRIRGIPRKNVLNEGLEIIVLGPDLRYKLKFDDFCENDRFPFPGFLLNFQGVQFTSVIFCSEVGEHWSDCC